MTEKSMARADFYTSIVLMAFGIGIIIIALQMPTMTEKGEGPYSAPGLLPILLGSVITVLSGFMFGRSIVRIGKDITVPANAFKAFFSEVGTRRMTQTIILCALYSISLGKVLFPLTTFLFVFIFILVFEYNLKETFKSQMKKVLVAIFLSVCVSAAITGTFQYLFLVNLP